jgi:parallel beta-helix repeat protein
LRASGKRLLAAVLAVACPLVVAPTSGGGVQSRAWNACDKVISSRGSVSRLARALRPGQTGCLRRGTYYEDVRIRQGGRRGRPITLRSYPGETALVVGRFAVYRRARAVHISRLYLDGVNPDRLPSPSVAGADVTFSRVDVTNRHTGICFSLGAPGFGIAERTVIRQSRIHDCGRLPATNHDHGIYLAESRDARILSNWIYRNADRGIQLFPDAQRTVIRGNVIDGNGQGIAFGGGPLAASDDTLVEGNLITNSTIRDNVESHYGSSAPVGQRNLVRRNCIAGGVRGAPVDVVGLGFALVENLFSLPRYLDSTGGDYRLRPSDPCVRLFAGNPAFRPGPARFRAK